MLKCWTLKISHNFVSVHSKRSTFEWIDFARSQVTRVAGHESVDDWNSRTIRYQIRSTKDEKRSYEELGCLESSDNPWNGQSLEKERERERKENVNSTSICDFNRMKNFLSVRWQWKRLFSRRKIDIIAIDEGHFCQERCIEYACLLRYYWKTPTKLSI